MLRHSVKHTNKFERGRVDEFFVEAVDLGDIKKVKIGHESNKSLDGWYLDKVIIENTTMVDKRFVFECFKWLDATKDDGLTIRELDGCSILQGTTYQVSVKTGTEQGAGTDANVFLSIHGKEESTGTLPLKHSTGFKNKFEAGRIDTFELTSVKIDEIKSIKLWHDGSGIGSAWFVDQVIILVPDSGKKYTFSIRKWLKKEDGTSEIELEPTKFELLEGLTPYEVLIYTSDIQGAGTDANVFMQIYGAGLNKKTQRLELRNRSDNFQKGSVDKFKIYGLDVGAITKLRVGHDNSGPGPGWHLAKINIQKISSKSVVIPPTKPELARSRTPISQDGHSSRTGKTTYTVDVKTGDRFGAGTDAHVFLTLFGAKSDCGERRLSHSSTHKNKFERNNVDKFTVKALDLGPLKKLKIRHDNAKGAAPWYLDYIYVSAPESDGKIKDYLFTCYKWLSSTDGDGLISRELIPADPITFAKWRDGKNVKDEARLSEEDDLYSPKFAITDQLTSYTVKVHTGKKPGAGTDANVHIVLYGQEDDTGVVPLKTSIKPDGSVRSNKFEAGNVDTFKIKAVDIGPIKKLTVGHDNSGGGAAWYLDFIEVEALKLGETLFFPCEAWIGLNKGQETTYEIVTYTSDLTGAGTQALVFIQLYGEGGTASDLIQLNVGPEARTKFKRGKKDAFYLELDQLLEPLTKIRVGHDGGGLGSDWHLDKVEVRRILDENHTTLTYEFACGKWLNKDHKEYELLVSHAYEAKVDESGQTTIEKHEVDKTITMKHYHIRVKTGDLDGSGTDANVYLTIQGDRGDTGERKLASSLTYMDKFERGHTDIFAWEAADLGTIYKTRIRHDNSGPSASWFLDSIEVQEVTGEWKERKATAAGEVVLFRCERWLSKTKSDKRCERTLYCEGYQGDKSSSGTLASVRGSSLNLQASQSDLLNNSGSLLSIRGGRSPRNIPSAALKLTPEDALIEAPTMTAIVKLTTGSMPDAGSKGPVWLEITGDKGIESGKLLLQSLETGNEIPKACTKQYTFDVIEMAGISLIQIGNEAIGSENSSLFVQLVQIELPTKGLRYTVKCGTWLSKFKEDNLTVRTFKVTPDMAKRFNSLLKYSLRVETADVEQAGTDCQIFLKLFGSKGDSNEIELDKNGDRFERNSKDILALELEDVGEIRKIRLRHSGVYISSSFPKALIIMDYDSSFYGNKPSCPLPILLTLDQLADEK
ncbi:Lipoxygenase y domain-containing protein 1 [Cichlidogyrus casuarinus]|uniref:Lipoxygenase y domain-containing protein 1 n=1 Tax=Cichlidogyrus casuarinus TaxID=1844966 RepID=A0ABD2QC76_9PLAT